MKKNMKKFIAGIMAAAMAAAMCTAVSAPAYADWEKKSGKTYYSDEDGSYVTGFQNIDGNRYYFSKSGVMKKGWLTMSSGKTYYFKSTGKMAKGWVKIDSEKYYFNKDGVMATGYTLINKSIYEFGDDGTSYGMVKGELVEIGGKLYYCTNSGKLASGIQTVSTSQGDVTYYFGSKGYSEGGTKTIDGVDYTFDSKKGLKSVGVDVKTEQPYDIRLNVSNFKVTNNMQGLNNEVSYSALIMNTDTQANNVKIYADFYGKGGSVVKSNQLIYSNYKMERNQSETMTGSISTDQLIYKVVIRKYSIYKSN